MRNNLTQKEVGEVPALELIIRFNYLLEKAETVPVNEITMADAREILWIEEELPRRLIKLIGHDFYPPVVPSKPTMAELKTSVKASLKAIVTPTPQAKPLPKVAKPVVKTEGKLRFKVTITSSIGSIVKEENVKVDSRSEADTEAHTMIKQLGLKKAKYKIT